MGTIRFSKGEIEAMRKLQVALSAEDGGDTSWIDDLPELPDQTAEDSVIAIVRPKRSEGSEESDEPNA